MASGSFDNTVKIWGANLVTEAAEGSSVPEGGSEAKRAKTGQSSGRAVTRTPPSTLGGHKEAVAGVAWLGKDELASASWDHTIKVGGFGSVMIRLSCLHIWLQMLSYRLK